MKSIKKFAAIVTVFVMLGSTSVSANASFHFGDGNHYRDPGIRCYGGCFHPDTGIFGIVHQCTVCGQKRTT